MIKNILCIFSREYHIQVSPGRQAVVLGVYPKEGRNLVDYDNINNIVSKIKTCMSKYKYYTLKLHIDHYISHILFDCPLIIG